MLWRVYCTFADHDQFPFLVRRINTNLSALVLAEAIWLKRPIRRRGRIDSQAVVVLLEGVIGAGVDVSGRWLKLG